MKRRHIIRIQVAVLVLLTLVVLLRAFSGDGGPDGVVAISNIEAYRLEQGAFQVTEPAQIHVSATGSAESRSDTSLAAYAWILRHDDRQLVWVMDGRSSRSGSGTLVHQDTTLSLEPGAYEAYFTSFGNRVSSGGSRSFFSRLFDERQHWVNDAREWHLVVQPLDGARDFVEQVSIEDLLESTPPTLWHSGRMRDRSTAEELVEVAEPVSVRIYSVGEISDEPNDYAWVRRATDDHEVWSLTAENSSWAGGAPLNRMFRGELSLEPGVHSFGFRTDPGHAYGAWRANPPFDPHGWGLRVEYVRPADSVHVTAFDPWKTLQPAVSLTQVGNDARRAARIEVERATPVVVYSLGEIGRNRFDYGTLRPEEGDSSVWEMTRERSTPAGGDESNRREIAFLTLEPGRYLLEYRTDGSHAYDDWRNGEPRHPDRWGVTLFTMKGDSLAAVQEIDRAEAPEAADVGAPPPPPAPEGAELVRMTQIGNDRRESRSFELDRTTDVYVRAVGELTLSNRYDYGWIENAETGQTVWEMTYSNTEHAGGDSRNRKFEGVVKLPPGRYVAHFQSDFSHAYGDFPSEEETPQDPEAWGIVIRPQT